MNAVFMRFAPDAFGTSPAQALGGGGLVRGETKRKRAGAAAAEGPAPEPRAKLTKEEDNARRKLRMRARRARDATQLEEATATVQAAEAEHMQLASTLAEMRAEATRLRAHEPGYSGLGDGMLPHMEM